MTKQITNVYGETSVNISKIGAEGKFVNVTEKCKFDKSKKKFFHTGEYEIDKGVMFSSDDFEKEKLTTEEKCCSLKRMIICLEQHITKEVEIEIDRLRYEVQSRIREKYQLKTLQEKLKSMQASLEEY